MKGNEIQMVATFLFRGKDCNINVDKKGSDWWRESYEYRTSDRGKGNLTFKEVILQVSTIKPSLHYPQSYGGVGGVGRGCNDFDYDDDDGDDGYDDHDHDHGHDDGDGTPDF